jgi:hypothetical protein
LLRLRGWSRSRSTGSSLSLVGVGVGVGTTALACGALLGATAGAGLSWSSETMGTGLEAAPCARSGEPPDKRRAAALTSATASTAPAEISAMRRERGGASTGIGTLFSVEVTCRLGAAELGPLPN